ADRNKEVRVSSYQVRLVVTCPPDGVAKAKRRSWDLRCTLDDVALKAAALAGDRGRLTPILEEMDAKLTGAGLVMTMRDDGRITRFDLTGIEVSNRRTRQMEQTLRI